METFGRCPRPSAVVRPALAPRLPTGCYCHKSLPLRGCFTRRSVRGLRPVRAGSRGRPAPLPAPARWGGRAPRRGSGQGEPLKRFVPPRWRREWCRQRKERQRVVPRGFAAAPLFPGRKKQTAKGMGRSPPGDPWGRVPGPEGKGGVSSLPHTLGKALAVDGKVAGRCGRREDSERQAVGTAQPSF